MDGHRACLDGDCTSGFQSFESVRTGVWFVLLCLIGTAICFRVARPDGDAASPDGALLASAHLGRADSPALFATRTSQRSGGCLERCGYGNTPHVDPADSTVMPSPGIGH